MTRISADQHLTIALRDGMPVRISEVGRGLGCGCACANCGNRLIARKGSIRAHHFSHASGDECTATPLETAIHNLAKHTVARCGFELSLPKYQLMLPRRYRHYAGDATGLARNIQVSEVRGGRARVCRGNTEVKLGPMRVDALVEVGARPPGKKLVIEIDVHHPCTRAKRALIRRSRIPAIEIHLAGLVEAERQPATSTPLDQVLSDWLSDPDNVEWLYHPAEENHRPALARWIRQARALTPKPPRGSPSAGPAQTLVGASSAAPVSGKAAEDSRRETRNSSRSETARARLDRWVTDFEKRNGRLPGIDEYRTAWARVTGS